MSQQQPSGDATDHDAIWTRVDLIARNVMQRTSLVPNGRYDKQDLIQVARIAIYHALEQDPTLANYKLLRVGRNAVVDMIRSQLGRSGHKAEHERGIISLEGSPAFTSDSDSYGLTLKDMLVDDYDDPVAQTVIRDEVVELLYQALLSLPAREQTIIRETFYLSRPIKEIVVEMGLSESRIHQIRKRGLKLMATWLEPHLIIQEDLYGSGVSSTFTTHGVTLPG